ncbi:uncharacterized protein LOC122499028 [Leptopilina heterotoma]|uniref:uncharacterized protein LOC122499028 n=1 Tax=Leptopilina heterotoma TaxID=63436 RepID=UPI001CA94FFD|nr:uncharacterized protein LOC122499028 [Leptopilina heterotoma]
MIDAGFDNPCVIEEMSILLTDKYPQYFECAYGAKHDQTHARMKNCFKYLRTKDKKSSRCKGTSSSKVEPKKPSMKKELQSTRRSRMMAISKVNASEILDRYPALRRKDMLLEEFCQLINLTANDLKQNWIEILPKVITALQISGKNLSFDGQTMAVLYHLPKLFTKAKEGGKILNCFPSGTPIANTIPGVDEAPKLIAIANRPLNMMHTMCYIDGTPIFEAHGYEAILLLLAVYWIFQVQFPANAKQQFAFISISILRDVAVKDIDANILKKITLTNVLKSCDLLPTSST